MSVKWAGGVDEFAPLEIPILGIADVARNHRVDYPVTVYRVALDETSGVMGVLYPDGHYCQAGPSNVGGTWACFDPQGQWWEGSVVWDGAKPTEGEHSRGLLLGPYENSGALWRAMSAGRRMQ